MHVYPLHNPPCCCSARPVLSNAPTIIPSAQPETTPVKCTGQSSAMHRKLTNGVNSKKVEILDSLTEVLPNITFSYEISDRR